MTEAVDLHVHTTHSDGTSTPAAVVAGAIEANLAAVAVTDHDTVAGIAEALTAARERRVEVVPGVELSAEHEGVETHIVGLFIDPTNGPLARALREKREGRRRRVAAMARRLAEARRPVDLEAVLAEVEPDSVSRMHLAEAMRRAGYVQDVQEAFYRWLSETGPAYVPRRRFTVREACDLIRGAGGLPVLGHPEALTRKTLAQEAREGIAAVEAYSPGFAPGWSHRLRQWARELDIGISGGSDYHGRPGEGAPIGAIRVPMAYLEDLRRRCDIGAKRRDGEKGWSWDGHSAG